MRVSKRTASICAVSAAVILAAGVTACHERCLASTPLTDLVARATAHVYELLRAIGSTTIGRVGTLVVLVLIVEAVVSGWRGSSLFRLIFKRSKTAIVDIVFFASLHLQLLAFVEIAFTLGVSLLASQFIAWISSHYGWSRLVLPSDGVFDTGASLAVFWLLTSFVQYWGHRWMHVPMFWRLHRFHHASTELNVISAFRQHPLEPVFLRFLSIVSPLIFFDVSQRILLVYFFVYTITDLLAHSELPWGYGWIGRWIVQSPRVHQVHHSIEDEHQNLNFSFCPLWDHVFGTWYKGSNEPSKFGIADPAYEQRPLRQFALDAWMFYASLMQWARSLPDKCRAIGADAPPVGRIEINRP